MSRHGPAVDVDSTINYDELPEYPAPDRDGTEWSNTIERGNLTCRRGLVEKSTLVSNLEFPEGAVVWVESGDVEEYISEYAHNEIQIPEYYGDFDNDQYHATGVLTNAEGNERVADGHDTWGISHRQIQAALRLLNGEGHYTHSDYSLHTLSKTGDYGAVLTHRDGRAVIFAPVSTTRVRVE